MALYLLGELHSIKRREIMNAEFGLTVTYYTARCTYNGQR